MRISFLFLYSLIFSTTFLIAEPLDPKVGKEGSFAAVDSQDQPAERKETASEPETSPATEADKIEIDKSIPPDGQWDAFPDGLEDSQKVPAPAKETAPAPEKKNEAEESMTLEGQWDAIPPARDPTEKPASSDIEKPASSEVERPAPSKETDAKTETTPAAAVEKTEEDKTVTLEGEGDDASAGVEDDQWKPELSKEPALKKEEDPSPDVKQSEGDGAILKLTLQQVIEDVVFYNPSVEQFRLEWLASLHNSKASWGDFEPEIVGQFIHSDLERENTILEQFQQGGNRKFFEKKDEYRIGIEGKLLSGADYNVSYSLTDSKNTLTLNDEFQSFAGVTLKQPIFKGAWFGAPWSKIKVSKVDRRIAFHNFRTRLMRIIFETEAAYWNLTFTEEKYRVAGESVEIARKLVKDSQIRVKTGKMSRLDLVEAEAGLADRLGNQADSRQELLEAVNTLKLLLSSDKIGKESWIRTATPMYDPADQTDDMSEDDSLEEALKIQPDYLVKRYEVEREKIVLDFQKSEYLPEVNLTGSYGYNSIGRTSQEAWRKLNVGDTRVWNAGVELRLPLLMGVKGRHLLAAERLRKQTAEESLKAVEYDIASSLRTLRRRIKALRERITNARSVVDYRKRLLDVELVRLKAGKSNTRVIYETEENLADAKQFELESMVRHREAMIQLALISGVLLADKGLETVEDSRPILSENLIQPNR